MQLIIKRAGFGIIGYKPNYIKLMAEIDNSDPIEIKCPRITSDFEGARRV